MYRAYVNRKRFALLFLSIISTYFVISTENISFPKEITEFPLVEERFVGRNAIDYLFNTSPKQVCRDAKNLIVETAKSTEQAKINSLAIGFLHGLFNAWLAPELQQKKIHVKINGSSCLLSVYRLPTASIFIGKNELAWKTAKEMCFVGAHIISMREGIGQGGVLNAYDAALYYVMGKYLGGRLLPFSFKKLLSKDCNLNELLAVDLDLHLLAVIVKSVIN